MKLFIDPVLMPSESEMFLLMCEIPDHKKIISRLELIPYLEERIFNMLVRSEQSLERLDNIISDLEVIYPLPLTKKDLLYPIVESSQFKKMIYEDLTYKKADWCLEDIDLQELSELYNSFKIESYLELLEEIYY